MGDAKAMKMRIWRIPSLIILIIASCLTCSACLLVAPAQASNRAEIIATEPPVSTAEITVTAHAANTAEATSTPQTGNNAASDPSGIFSKIPDTFLFLSGAGAWETFMTLNPDGTFTGNYTDDDMGDGGDSYPNGTRYVSNFNGKFTDVKKISDKEYSMRLDYFHVDGIVDQKTIVDGVRIITTEPAGFDNAGEFRLYLPGRRTADLPEAFLDWVRGPMDLGDDAVELPSYGIYNIGGEEGFFADDSN